MTENSGNLTMATETNITALKETLCAQQKLLQQLYNELDVEREASASAASEALSMILRLQGEKAAVKMEAEQYKRLAEEKMHHAEESMQIFEDVIYQKEMEIASLDYQVQAYRYRLLSLGFDDIGVNEIKFPQNLLQRNETVVGEPSSESLSRRNSAPPKLLKLAYFKRGTLERDRSISPDSDMISKIVEESEQEDENHQNSDSEKKADGFSSVDISSYWEEIRKLDKIVEEVAGEQYSSIRSRSSRSCSVQSQLNELDQAQSPEKSMDNEIFSDATSTSVHDVFEVPETGESITICEQNAKNENPIFKGKEKVRKLVTFQREAISSSDKDEIDSGKKSLMLKHKDKRLLLPRDGISVDCHLAIVRPATVVAEAQALCQQRNRITEIVEAERQDGSLEPVNMRGGEEELRLLYEIREKLDSIQSDIRSRNTETRKASPNYDLPMLQLTEAMVHFWL